MGVLSMNEGEIHEVGMLDRGPRVRWYCHNTTVDGRGKKTPGAAHTMMT